MKNFLISSLFCLAALGCAKESNVLSAPAQTQAITDAAVDRDDCYCSIRVDVPSTPGVSHEFNIMINHFIPFWFGYITPAECGGANIRSGIWYPINFQNGLQYQVNYTCKQGCSTLKAGNATFSVRCGTTTTTYPLQTGDSPATNPDIVYFSKNGCIISEGEIY